MSISRQALVVVLLAVCGCGEPAAPPPLITGGAGGAPAGGAGGRANGGAGGAAGLNGASGGPPLTPGTFAHVAEIMRQNCGASACHGGGFDGQDLVYTNIATLHSVLTTTVVEWCGNNFVVAPGDPANSALLKLPNWDCTDASGGPFVMPQGCIDDPCLTQPELSSITAWIMAGAKP